MSRHTPSLSNEQVHELHLARILRVLRALQLVSQAQYRNCSLLLTLYMMDRRDGTNLLGTWRTRKGTL